MRRYQISGTGTSTGRKRKRVYSATSEEHARELATADETAVDIIEELPPEPPSESQLSFAAELGIALPPGVGKHDVSALISRHTQRDKEPTARHWGFAASYGVEANQHVGKKMLFDTIHASLTHPGREHELVEWFTFRVYRELVKGADSALLDSPKSPLFTAIAHELAADGKVVESVRRYDGQQLIWFGNWTSPDGREHQGGSKRTTAYKRVADLLRARVEIPAKAAPSTSTPKTLRPSESKQEERVDASALAKTLAIITVAGLLWLYLT